MQQQFQEGGPIYANCGNSDFGSASNYGYGGGGLENLQQLEVEVDQEQVYNSPPSPVSSSYSELKQATKFPPGYHIQQMYQQQQVRKILLFLPFLKITKSKVIDLNRLISFI